MRTIVSIAVVLSVFALGYMTGRMNDAELNSYKEYYKATECLLDTLEKYDNWVDRFDPEDYYSAIEKLNY